MKRYWAFWFVLCVLFPTVAARGKTVDLLERYPTTLVAGDTSPERARPWEFTSADVFRLSRFTLEVGKDLQVEVGPADVGIGHCADGAVWAVVIPRSGGSLISGAIGSGELISSVWLRFHPMEIRRLFPPETVFADRASTLTARMRIIANAKFGGSWHAGPNALIPEPKDLTVDVDTAGGVRRFFVVDLRASTARYVAAFEKRAVRQPPAVTPTLAAAAFDQLWEAFDRGYAMFALRPEVDWTKLRERYRPLALRSRSAYELAGVCADMLKQLRDLHVWLTVAGTNVPVFNRPRSSNANPQADESILGGLNKAGRYVAWTVTKDKIGYIAIYGWRDSSVSDQCNEVLDEMRDTRGLIVDVRLNGGGDEPSAMKFAGRFLQREFVYAYSQYRDGPRHSDLTEKIPRTIGPSGPWQYDRPVILLIGQKCMSSNESFIAMMTGGEHVTTMGDHTCGSSGNPRMVHLPLDMTVSVPRWIDYLPDGTPLDERGVQPQVVFKAEPGAFDGNHDDLLTAALERLRKAPLPDKPIEGRAAVPAEKLPWNHLAEVKEDAQDPSRPHVVSVTPADNAKDVPTTTVIRVRFDRPMDPLSLNLVWKSGGFLDCEYPRYNPDRYEFSIPVHLIPGTVQEVVVNGDKYNGGVFLSADSETADRFAWQFRTRGVPATSAGLPPRVLAISPPSGSTVPLLTFVEIQFDQPMAPSAKQFPHVVGGLITKAATLQNVHYDPSTRTIRFPLILAPNKKASFTLAGFRSANWVAAEPIHIQYQASTEEMTKSEREKILAAAKDPRALDLLRSMKQARARLTSLDERVQKLMLTPGDGFYTGLHSAKAVFKWQKPNRYYGDVSEMMSCPAFRIGCDGRQWWWHFESDREKKLVTCKVGEMGQRCVSLCDPFDLTQKTPKAAAAHLGLNYAGQAKRGGKDCSTLEAWSVEGQRDWVVGGLTRWWIDPDSLRPVEIEQVISFGVYRTRFFYDGGNKPPLDDSFAAPMIKGLSPKPDKLGAGYTTHLIILRDGGDGCISVRWGEQGPAGTVGSGMN